MRLIATLAAAALAPAAAGTDLVNKDSRPYTATVASGGAATQLSLAAKSVRLAVCPSTAAVCIVTVAGVGEIEVTGADDVIVENGRLTKK